MELSNFYKESYLEHLGLLSEDELKHLKNKILVELERKAQVKRLLAKLGYNPNRSETDDMIREHNNSYTH